MKNHKLINKQLIKTNKTFSELSGKQREKINQWLHESYLNFYKENKKIPMKKNDYIILEYVFEKINENNIWIPECEIKKYFSLFGIVCPMNKSL